MAFPKPFSLSSAVLGTVLIAAGAAGAELPFVSVKVSRSRPTTDVIYAGKPVCVYLTVRASEQPLPSDLAVDDMLLQASVFLIREERFAATRFDLPPTPGWFENFVQQAEAAAATPPFDVRLPMNSAAAATSSEPVPTGNGRVIGRAEACLGDASHLQPGTYRVVAIVRDPRPTPTLRLKWNGAATADVEIRYREATTDSDREQVTHAEYEDAVAAKRWADAAHLAARLVELRDTAAYQELLADSLSHAERWGEAATHYERAIALIEQSRASQGTDAAYSDSAAERLARLRRYVLSAREKSSTAGSTKPH